MTTVADSPKTQWREIGRFVHSRVSALQSAYLDPGRGSARASAVATLARLRRGIGKEVGALPDLWEVLAGLPGELRDDGRPTWQERAAYTAITLYALHQQSKSEPMHVPGRRLGEALRELRKSSPSEDPVRRRFLALGTAQSFTETVYHVRGLITLLRSHSIGLDYGSFADDLYWLQTTRADRVRLQWGRDFYRPVNDNTPAEGHPQDKE